MSITLKDFLTPLKTLNVKVVVKDTDLNILCKFYADSISSLNEVLALRTVNSWDIIKNNALTIYLDGTSQPDIPVESVTLSESALNIQVGMSMRIFATVLPEDATYPEVTWFSSDVTIASVEDGVITGHNEGNVTIYATADEVVSNMCEVVVESVVPIIPVESISLQETEISLNTGDTYTLIPTILPENATDKSVSWISSNEAIATVQDGLVNALMDGNVTITVTTFDGGFEASCEVIISEPIIQVESVSINESSIDLVEGAEPIQLSVTILPNDATDKSVVWASSNEEVAIVDENGLLTIIGVGTTDITASSGDIVSEPCIINVSQAIIQVESVTLNESTLNLEVGGEQVTLTAEVLPENATDKTVSWTSSDENVVTVNDGVITIIGEGNAEITASAGDVVSEPCEVIVSQP